MRPTEKFVAHDKLAHEGREGGGGPAEDTMAESGGLVPDVTVDALRATAAGNGAPRMWRSLDELAGTPAFAQHVENEFPHGPNDSLATSGATLDRRQILKVMAASAALAGLTGCTKMPTQKILPYVRQPEEIVPGKPLFYATAMPLGGIATGVLVESNMARPTKVEGNPDHPGSMGGSDVFMQGAVLSLYDPDRSQAVIRDGRIGSWNDFQREMAITLEQQRAQRGDGLHILTETVTSPTLGAQMQALLATFPGAQWHQYESVSRDAAHEGAKLAFGEEVDAVYRVDRAKVLLALDADFLCTGPGCLRYARDFARGRRDADTRGTMNRLYAVESTPTNTGAVADHRLQLRAGEIEGFARALAQQLGIAGVAGVPASSQSPAAQTTWIATLARDLQQNLGACLVVVGDQQPAIVHALGHAINQRLGNFDKTVYFIPPLEARPLNQWASLGALVTDLRAGRVDALLILGGNPAYDAPADLGVADLVPRVKFSARLGLYEDETSALCHWHIPQTHFLEEWGDAKGFDGTVSLIQPLIAPLYNGKSAYEFLALLNGNPGKGGHELVREYWRGQFGSGVQTGTTRANSTALAGTPGGNGRTPKVQEGSAQGGNTEGADVQAGNAAASNAPPSSAAPPNASLSNTSPPNASLSNASAVNAQSASGSSANSVQVNARPAGVGSATTGTDRFESFWEKTLRDGVMAGSAPAAKTVSLRGDFAAQPETGQPAAMQGLEIIFRPDPTVWDGRFANNGWLQELPKPLTKLTWDSVAAFSPRTAQRLGIKTEDTVELKYQGRTVLAPAWIMPGHADESATVFLGYGRTRAGRVGTGVGFDAGRLRPAGAPWFGTGLSVRKTGARWSLAETQHHSSMEGRDLVRVATLAEYRADPAFAQKDVEKDPASLYPHWKEEGYQWGMAIDLNTCTGCGSCVIACQAENNISVVGKNEVLNGREMHWIRIDRYYEGDPAAPNTYHEPVPCMHCENAPCELVCPVGATVHSAEGLNEMVYNRCVGTRYCSNNCPYKVRRFNFRLYADWNTPSLFGMRNPNVTVRSRGVMEKCTYCVQRISAGKIDAEKQDRLVRDGEIVTACQQACPSEAIVFGNVADPQSRVSKLKAKQLNYALLADLNTRPRTTYQARLLNPNPEMPRTPG